MPGCTVVTPWPLARRSPVPAEVVAAEEAEAVPGVPCAPVCAEWIGCREAAPPVLVVRTTEAPGDCDRLLDFIEGLREKKGKVEGESDR